MPQPNTFLSVRGLSHTYHTKNGETPALKDIHFDLFTGEFAAIIGPSGCGKSTLLELIAGLIPLQKGSLRYPFLNQPPSIGYMLQKDHLLEYRTIYKNIILGLEIQHRLTEKNLEYVQKLMQQYDIADFADSYPRELSGGMRQRAALIRTLALKPDFLLLDEPFSALDYQTRLDVSDDIAKIIRQSGVTTLLVTHDLSEAISISDRIIVLGKRPGHIRSIITIDFGSEHQLSSKEARIHPQFQNYFNQIWNSNFYICIFYYFMGDIFPQRNHQCLYLQQPFPDASCLSGTIPHRRPLKTHWHHTCRDVRQFFSRCLHKSSYCHTPLVEYNIK